MADVRVQKMSAKMTVGGSHHPRSAERRVTWPRLRCRGETEGTAVTAMGKGRGSSDSSSGSDGARRGAQPRLWVVCGWGVWRGPGWVGRRQLSDWRRCVPFSALLCPQLSGVLVLCRGLPPVFEGSAHTHVRAGGGGGNEDFAGLMPVYILSLSPSLTLRCAAAALWHCARCHPK